MTRWGESSLILIIITNKMLWMENSFYAYDWTTSDGIVIYDSFTTKTYDVLRSSYTEHYLQYGVANDGQMQIILPNDSQLQNCVASFGDLLRMKSVALKAFLIIIMKKKSCKHFTDVKHNGC